MSTLLLASICSFLELSLNVKSEFNLFSRNSAMQAYRLNKVDNENCHFERGYYQLILLFYLRIRLMH